MPYWYPFCLIHTRNNAPPSYIRLLRPSILDFQSSHLCPILISHIYPIYKFSVSAYSYLFSVPDTLSSYLYQTLSLYIRFLTQSILVNSFSVMCWTSPFVTLEKLGLFCRFYSFWWKILLTNIVYPKQTPHYVAPKLWIIDVRRLVVKCCWTPTVRNL